MYRLPFWRKKPSWDRRLAQSIFWTAAVLMSAVGLLTALLVTASLVIDALTPKPAEVIYGATFSPPYARSLGIDWHAAYTAMLDDLKMREVRIPVYWEEVEPQEGVYDYADVDWEVSEAAKRGAAVTLAVGLKVPRWPECHIPDWAASWPTDRLHAGMVGLIDRTIRRYKDERAVVRWQIENEPFLPFGICPKPDAAFLKSEVAAAHALDRRPVLIQDAGEFSTWQPTARLADELGVSLYRIVWAKYLGYVRWPGLGLFYQLRMLLARRYVGEVILTELQAEPWTTQDIVKMPLAEQLAQMNPAELAKNIQFAREIGFGHVWLWGVEWWYWLKVAEGHPEVWEYMRQVVAGTASFGP